MADRRRAVGASSLLIAVLLLAAGAAFAAEPRYPALTGRVVDEAGTLSPGTRERLAEMLAAHEQQTGQQVVVVTLKSLQGFAIEEFGYQLGRHWGIGQKDKNTGALLVVAPNERKVRIEVGYGLEGQLTDAQSRVIIDQVIVPAFRRGDFNGGVLEGTAAMLRVLGGTAEPGAPRQRVPAHVVAGAHMLLTLAVLLVLWIMVWSRSRRAFGGGVPPIWYFPAGVGRGFSGGSSGGGSFGGGFSGGGGSFGGGGASGSW